MEKDRYSEDAQIKKDYVRDNDARIRMDTEKEYAAKEEMPYAGPYLNQTTDSAQPLETIEQEKNRLTRQLNETIDYNETVIRTLHEMLHRTVIYQNKSRVLLEALHNNSRNQLFNLNQLREHLK